MQSADVTNYETDTQCNYIHQARQIGDANATCNEREGEKVQISTQASIGTLDVCALNYATSFGICYFNSAYIILGGDHDDCTYEVLYVLK